MKKAGGSNDFKYETTYILMACKWYNNESVQLVSNYMDQEPMSVCKRWERPAIAECYNKHMDLGII